MAKIEVCKACKNSTFSDKGMIADGRICKCTKCGSLFISVKEFDPYEEEYGNAYRNNFDDQKPDKLIEMFDKYLENVSLPGKRLLDIGSGDGAFLSLAKKSGFEVCGLEVDPNAVENLKKKGFDAVLGKLGDDDMSLGRDFDCITLWDVIEHIDNIEETMKFLTANISKGGVVALVTPNSESLLDTFANIERNLSLRKSQKIMQICLNRYHVNRFSPQGMTELFNRFGFETIKVLPVQIFSLKPETYLDSFAPGIESLSTSKRLNQWASAMAYKAIISLNIKNKFFFIARKK